MGKETRGREEAWMNGWMDDGWIDIRCLQCYKRAMARERGIRQQMKEDKRQPCECKEEIHMRGVNLTTAIEINRTPPRRFCAPSAAPSSCSLVIASQIRASRFMQSHCAPSKSSRTAFAASTFAGLSRLGLSEDRREITLINCKKRVRTIAKGI